MTEVMKNSDIQAAIDAGRELAVKPFEINGTPCLVVPDNYMAQFYDNLRDKPQHIDEAVTHITAESFIDYYQHYATDASCVFLDIRTAKFTAVFDYHEPGKPDWGKHRSVYELVTTPEWQSWRQNDSKIMTQTEFGSFIENNLLEIVTPANGEMLEIALSFQAKTRVDFSKAVRLDNGQTQLHYAETVESKAGVTGQLKIPDIFAIGLVLFRGGDAYQIDARFRYRIADGHLTLWYELIRPHKTVEACINATEKMITSKMEVGKFYSANTLKI